MAKKRNVVRRMGIGNLLSDRDWITIIGVLLHDRSAESQRLAEILLARTKQGRHVRLLRAIYKRRPTTTGMQRAVRMSRRTIFRYLNSLEDYGVKFRIDDHFRYEIERLPKAFQRLL